MKRLQFLAAALFLACVPAACGGETSAADHQKPIAEVKTEAQAADAAQLEKIVNQYKAKIAEVEPEIAAIKNKIKEIPITEALGDAAKNLKAESEELMGKLSGLKERLDIYVSELAKKKGQ